MLSAVGKARFLLAVSPSPWQQTFFGLIAIIAVAPGLALTVLILRRVIVEPRAAGRRWPEGAALFGLLRVPAEIVVDLTRAATSESPADRNRRDLFAGLRVGFAFAALSVVPLSAGVILAAPGLGVYVLPVACALEATVIGFLVRGTPLPSGGGGGDGGRSRQIVPAQIAAGATLLGLAAGVVHVQWGSGSMWPISAAQSTFKIFGLSMVGAPGLLVQAPAMVIAAAAAHLVLVSSRTMPTFGARRVVTGFAHELLLIAVSAWFAVVAFGGAAVPWTVTNDGVRHVLGVALVLSKTMVVACGFLWSSATWPAVSPGRTRVLLGAGIPILLFFLAGTLLCRQIV